MFSAAAERRACWYDGELDAFRPCTGLKLYGGINGSALVRIADGPLAPLTKRQSCCPWAFRAQFWMRRKGPFLLDAKAAGTSGCLVGVSGSNLAQGSEERFRLLLCADCDSKEVAHRREAAADKNIARRKLIDDGPHVRLHVDHDEICLRGNEESSVF